MSNGEPRCGCEIGLTYTAKAFAAIETFSAGVAQTMLLDNRIRSVYGVSERRCFAAKCAVG